MPNNWASQHDILVVRQRLEGAMLRCNMALMNLMEGAQLMQSKPIKTSGERGDAEPGWPARWLGRAAPRALLGSLRGIMTRQRRLSLALQGGGSFGAFTWGVLDRLLETDALALDTISGASAGAVNAVILAD